MVVETSLDVSPEDFFSVLVQSVAQEIGVATGKDPEHVRVRSGLKFKRELRNYGGNAVEVKAEIVELTPQQAMTIAYRAPDGKTTISYQIEEADQGSRVRYSESYSNASTFNALNHKILQLFFQFSAKRRVRQRLNEMARYINARVEQ